MTDEREFNASDVQKATERAAAEFGIDVADLKYEVLDRGSEGFLGIGARDARILVSPAQSTEQAEPSEVPEEPLFAPLPSENPKQFEDTNALSPENSEEAVDATDEDLSPENVVVASDDELEEIKAVTESFVSAMGFQSRVDVRETDDSIVADIVSDHTALLIGQKGETLDSLQHLVNCAAHQQRYISKRITLDSEGYRQRRVEAIQGMAHRAARKSLREDQNAKLPPMSSTERRIVHVYLEDDESVTTYSEGSGDSRRVVISPASR